MGLQHNDPFLLFSGCQGFRGGGNERDPVAAVAQDIHKKNNIYIYIYTRKFLIKVGTQREGQNFLMFISCRYLVELGLPVADLVVAEDFGGGGGQ